MVHLGEFLQFAPAAGSSQYQCRSLQEMEEPIVLGRIASPGSPATADGRHDRRLIRGSSHIPSVLSISANHSADVPGRAGGIGALVADSKLPRGWMQQPARYFGRRSRYLRLRMRLETRRDSMREMRLV